MGSLGSINERQSGSSGVLLDNGDLVVIGRGFAYPWGYYPRVLRVGVGVNP